MLRGTLPLDPARGPVAPWPMAKNSSRNERDYPRAGQFGSHGNSDRVVNNFVDLLSLENPLNDINR